MSDRNPLLFDPARETVTLYPGSIESRLDDLRDRIAEAQIRESSDSSKRASDGPEDSEAMTLAREFDALVEAQSGKALDVTLEEIPDSAVRRLRGDHPPREGDDLDAAWEANRETFTLALARAMLVEPDMTEKQLDEFFDKAPTRHLGKLTAAAVRIMNDDGELPKQSAVSVLRGLTVNG